MHANNTVEAQDSNNMYSYKPLTTANTTLNSNSTSNILNIKLTLRKNKKADFYTPRMNFYT